ncbi:MAG: hypothetical protein JHC98_11615 [Thermoleophilaceae bacterium]|nr:hypothetical protein [Thermoleophilaceae bacterium]
MAEAEQPNSELEAVLQELAEPQGFDGIEERMAAIAPQLQELLDGALSAGGWFDDAHEGMVLKTATQPDADQRIDEVRNFVLEQTRLGMLVGVAVGWELAERLEARRADAQ